MSQSIKDPRQQITVLGKLIERLRREHQLSTATLAMLSGLSDAQVRAIEEGSSPAFVDEAHRADCARRIALAMGLPEHHFLQTDTPATTSKRIIRQTDTVAAASLARDEWQALPVADLKVITALRSIEYPYAPEQRRQGSPIIIALIVSLLLTGLMLGLTFMH